MKKRVGNPVQCNVTYFWRVLIEESKSTLNSKSKNWP